MIDEADSDKKEQSEGKRKITRKAISDKGYGGLPFLYRPNRQSKGKKLTVDEKQWNKDISHVRSVVENTQKRIKDFGVFRGEWHGGKDRKGQDFLSHTVGVVGSLVNFKLKKEPIRRNVRRVREGIQ